MFILGENFFCEHDVCLILGDNIFYGHDMSHMLVRAAPLEKGATVFAYPVQDPERHGVVEFDKQGKVISLEEKPEQPRSSYPVTGRYFYDNKVISYAASIKPSSRGEL